MKMNVLFAGVFLSICVSQSLSFFNMHKFCQRVLDHRPGVTITYTIQNHFVEPFFELSTNVTSQRGQPFIRFMEKAADMNPDFKFSATYFSKLGYFIEELNELRNIPNITYWQFLKAPSTFLNLGVSSFKPRNGDHIIFNYVQDSHP